MDTEKLMQRYPNVSRVEIEKMRKTENFLNQCSSIVCFSRTAESLDKVREHKKRKGRKSVEAGPLVQVLSVDVIPSGKLIDRNKPLTIHGRIYGEYLDKTTLKVVLRDLFNRNCDEAQVLGPSGGPLTLIGPDDPDCFEYCMPYKNITKLVLIAFMGEGNNLFAEKQLCCGDEDMIIYMEKVKLEYVHGEHFSLALRYIAMPLAVYAHVKVEFIYRELDGENLDKRFLNVKGKIAARYGNVKGSECTLFEKLNDNEFERVENDPDRGTASMRLSRCVLGVPAYSSLILDLDLSEFGTGRKILKQTVEFRVEDEMFEDDLIVDDDMLMRVTVGWVSSFPPGRLEVILLGDDESSAVEMLCDDDHIMDEASCIAVASSYLSRPWTLHPESPYLTSSVEIFSVFIGREKYKPLQVYGSIQVASSDKFTFYVFKRDTKNDAFGLPEHSKTLPLLDGSRAYDEDRSLKIKVDLKDVESLWHIKGYVKWDWQSIEEGSPSLNKQLCSVIQGQNGNFAAIHYTIFSEEADYAIVGLMVVPKKGGHFRPKIHGSLVAEYNDYDYNTRYNKDYYRIVLFQRNRDDAAQPGVDGFIPLSRSVVAVPKKSSLVIEADIGDGLSDELSFQEFEFDVGTIERGFIMEGNGYSIYLYVKWECGF